MPPIVKYIEVLPCEKVPIAFEKRLPQIFRKRFKRAPVVSIVRVDGVVIEPRLNELIIARIVQSALFKTRGWNFVHPQRFHPGVTDVARIGRARHAGHDLFPFVFPARVGLRGTAIPGSEKLPLLQREVRQLVNADEQKLRALIAVNVVLVAAVAEPCGGTVLPGDDMLGLVVALVHRAWNSSPELCEQ